MFRCHFPEPLRVTAVNTHHDCSSVMTSDICTLNSGWYWLSVVRECRVNELLASAMKAVKGSDNAQGRFSSFLYLRYHFSCVLTETGIHVFISFSVESNFSAYAESCNACRISEAADLQEPWWVGLYTDFCSDKWNFSVRESSSITIPLSIWRVESFPFSGL